MPLPGLSWTDLKIYLSSISIPRPHIFRQLFTQTQPHIGLIANAWDVAPADGSESIASARSALINNDFNVVPLNLRDFHAAHDLKAAMQAVHGVWITGGNTFYLRWCMRESGLDHIIHNLMADGFVYGGESAGAVAAGTTLHGIQVLDDPKDAPETIWEGLGLLDFGIIPHWDQEADRTYLDTAHTEMSGHTKVVTLTDTADLVLNA